MTRTAAQLLAQAARLLACALERWHDEGEPEPTAKLPPKSVEVERTRELLRKRGLR
ncbi:MAG: hypothetical protein ABIQ16_05635 [Polyangiaceae bacterium]